MKLLLFFTRAIPRGARAPNKTLILPTQRRKGRIWPLHINTGHIISFANVLSYHDLSFSTLKIQLGSYFNLRVSNRDDNGLYFRRSESEITQAATASCTLTLK